MDGLIAYALSKKYVDGKTSGIATGMSWKGTKENISDLPQSGNQVGDLWHINEDGNEYAWDGSKWEALGGINLTPEQIETAISNYFEDNPLPQDALIIDWNNKYANAYNDAKAAMQDGREVYLKIPNSENNPTQCIYLQATSWDQTYIVFGGFTGAYLPGEMFIFMYAHITDGLSNWFKWSTNFTFNPVLFRNLAPAYSSSSTYDLGDYINHDSNIYKCTTTISTPEEWNSAHWTAVTVMDEVVTSGGGSGLPDKTSVSPGDFLRLDAQKNPVWQTVPSAESNSFGGGS